MPMPLLSDDRTTYVGGAPWTLGRNAFKRHDDASEQMNIDGRATGDTEVFWNGTGAGDSGGDWAASGTGSETAGSMHSGTNGWDTGVMAENDDVIWDHGSEVDVAGGYSEIRFWVQPKAFPNGSRPKLKWFDSANDAVGEAVRLDDYAENMDLDEWQQIAIPIADFNLGADVQKLRLEARNTAGQHYWLDDIELVDADGSGPYRFEFAAPDANTVYHVSMIVLLIGAPSSGWNSDAFGSIAGGLGQGLVLRHRDTEAEDMLWRLVVKDNLGLFGYFHPQDDVVFADDVMVVGFMIKPGRASIKVTDKQILQFVVRDDLSSLSNMRAYVHYGVEEIEA
jgi:hypothetical protein